MADHSTVYTKIGSSQHLLIAPVHFDLWLPGTCDTYLLQLHLLTMWVLLFDQISSQAIPSIRVFVSDRYHNIHLMTAWWCAATSCLTKRQNHRAYYTYIYIYVYIYIYKYWYIRTTWRFYSSHNQVNSRSSIFFFESPGFCSPSEGVKFADIPNGLAAISKVQRYGNLMD